MKWVFEHKALQMFGLKLNKYEWFSPTWESWVAVARHYFKWMKKKMINASSELGLVKCPSPRPRPGIKNDIPGP